MGKKKKDASATGKSDTDRHQKARRMVGLPLQWFEVAQKLARQKSPPSPTVWWLCDLIRREAEAAGMTDLPPPPWETEDK